MTGSHLALRDDTGRDLALDPERWYRPPSPGERRLLEALDGPVLDVGCGPGRVLETLGHQGVMALGVEPVPAAATLARRKGCAVLQRSVFDRLPGESRWGAVLLLDGNIGIGGEPPRLLHRCKALVRPGGCVVAEVDPPGAPSRSCRARLERDGQSGAWFKWAVVGSDDIAALASDAGLAIRSVAHFDGRWIALLEHASVRDVCA